MILSCVRVHFNGCGCLIALVLVVLFFLVFVAGGG